MILSAAWNPTTLGGHLLTARAFTARGLAGFASINIEVVPEGTRLGSHTVAEGETLESIAVDYGMDADELADLNPDLPADGPAQGSELIVPENEVGSASAELEASADASSGAG
jgi:LysM repeat protein